MPSVAREAVGLVAVMALLVLALTIVVSLV